MKQYILLGLTLVIAQLTFAQNGRSKAEVFIQIADRGSFTIYVDDESVGSTTGKFRFYDVYNRAPVISILQGTKKIYSNKVNVKFDERIIFNFSVREGLTQIKNLTIYRNGQYALDDFGNYAGAYNTGIVPPKPVPSISQFEILYNAVKKEPWDEGKTKLIQLYAANSSLNTSETILLLKTFSNDDKKLLAVKSLLPAISDVANAYSLTEAFTFMGTKDTFLDYLKSNGQQNPRGRGGMRASTYEDLKILVKKEAFDDGKTKVIQAAIQNSSPSSVQMVELLKMYSFDEKALEMAKLAYNFAANKQSYFILKEAFRFKSTQDAFLDFLARK